MLGASSVLHSHVFTVPQAVSLMQINFRTAASRRPAKML